MADNVTIDTGSDANVASDEVTYSGDTAQVQLVKVVATTGSEGARSVADTTFAEDSVAASGDQGTLVLAVRRDTAASSSGTDGDYSTVNTDSSGRVWVNASGAAVPVTDNSSTLSIDDGAGSITVDGTVAVSGTVTVGSHAVTNAGTFAVQADSVIPGTGATALGKAEDAVAASGDTGVVVLAVRRDVAASGVSADGDYAALSVTSDGSLRVSGSAGTTQYAEDVAAVSGDSLVIVGAVRRDTAANSTSTDGDYSTLSIDNTGALRVTIDSATTSSILTDDAAFTPGTSKVAVIGAEFDDSGTDSVDEGDGGAVRMSANRNLYVRIRDNAGNERGLNVDANGAIATTPSVAEDAAHSSGDIGIMALGVRAAAPTDRSAGPTDGDYEPFAVNEVGAVWGTLTPSANGGCSTFMASGSDGSTILVATAQAIKASAGVMYGYYAYNPEAAVTFVHFYNTAAASVTVGTTNPLFTIQIPAGSAANLSLPYGITFSNAGWSTAATTTAGGNTAPATGVSLTVWYK